jgi:hypothetical protein
MGLRLGAIGPKAGGAPSAEDLASVYISHNKCPIMSELFVNTVSALTLRDQLGLHSQLNYDYGYCRPVHSFSKYR